MVTELMSETEPPPSRIGCSVNDCYATLADLDVCGIASIGAKREGKPQQPQALRNRLKVQQRTLWPSRLGAYAAGKVLGILEASGASRAGGRSADDSRWRSSRKVTSRAVSSKARSSARENPPTAESRLRLTTAAGDSMKNQSTGLPRAPAMFTSSVAETFRSPDSTLTSAVRSRPIPAARSA